MSACRGAETACRPNSARMRAGLPVARLHREGAFDAGEVLHHEAAQRRRLRVRVEPGPRRVAQLGRGQRRRVQADDQRLGDLVAARLPDVGAGASKYGSTNGCEHAGSFACWKPSAVCAHDRVRQRCRCRPPTTHAACLASAVGNRRRGPARRPAAPLAVLSVASAAVDLGFGRPCRRRRGRSSSSQAQVGVDLEARRAATEPSRSAATASRAARRSRRAAAKNFTNWNCASLPASALWASVHSASPTSRDRSSRAPGRRTGSP